MKTHLILLKKFTFFLFLIVIISCKDQIYDEDIVDLKSFSLNSNISNFYVNSLNRENIKFTSNKQYVQKDTINEYDINWKGDRNKVFGVHYRVVSHSKNDTVAKYNNLRFFLVESMVNEHNDLMIMNAITKSSSSQINQFISELNTEFNEKPKVSKNDAGFFRYRILTWKNKNKLIKLVTEVKLDFSNIIIDEESKKAISNIEENDLDDSTLYICNPKYEKKLLNKVGTGNWSKFK